ncbi:MAG: cyclic nucleotide-binding domain-containing protein, partial [Sphingobacteriales bacterium]
MYNNYFNYLKKYTDEPLSEDEKSLIRQTFTPHKLRKRQTLLRPGEICRKYAFITKGSMRMYTVDEKGVERTVTLGIEEWWLGDRESFSHSTPSRYYIDALEDCEFLCITCQGETNLIKQVPAYAQMKVKLDQNNEIANNLRIISAISDDAEKRYADLLERYPEFSQRFPQTI